MKKIKSLVLLPIILLITGCNVEYNLTITKDSMTESSNFLYTDTAENRERLDYHWGIDQSVYYDFDSKTTKYYEKSKIEKDNIIGLNLKYEFGGDNLQKSLLLNRCYYKKSITKTDEYIIITTDGNTMCFYQDLTKNIDTLTVNIKTDLKVLEHNADNVKKGTYTWYFDENNYQNHPINIKMEIPQDKEDNTFLLISLAVLIVFVVAASIFGLFVLYQKRKNNKI